MTFLMGGLTNIADFLNAGTALRDRGRYLRSGTFRWFGSGSHVFTGVLVGYAAWSNATDVVPAGSAKGSFGIDGGLPFWVYGGGAVSVNRWCAGSLEVNGGVAWGVDYPPGANMPTYNEVTKAMDRLHKDGSWSPINHIFDYPRTAEGFKLGFVGTGLDVINQSGSGVVVCANLFNRPGSSWGEHTFNNLTSALDFFTDGGYRFSLVNGAMRWQSQASGDMGVGVHGSFGFVPYASNLTVKLRHSADGNHHIDAYVAHVIGA